ncbi:hypothetical protein [Paenibacillus etheri]|uniref:YgiT-type zinc finger domain-containing protein n=1 Tax=Paenibacillus etheri TaxID=1306852 RepID=A0A0W1B306_9BACL|nr:hypothetical protein [Paenibacillus etheri]KTD87934.1 hypothetical protein UQ64_07420 [Paenibacillus etheri]
MYTDNLMEKLCSCGGLMTLHMHSLIFNTKVKITHVPVYTCPVCTSYEPLSFIKADLGKLVKELNADEPRQDFSFTERNELASVLKESLSELIVGGFQELELAIRAIIQARVDMLLDLYRLAEELTDQNWMEETSRRLSQLTFQTTKNANY